MSQHDDVATLSDAALLNERARLQAKLQTLRHHAQNIPIDHNLEAAINDTDARLSRVDSRIEFRMRSNEGQLV
jgi:hypothetical protein